MQKFASAMQKFASRVQKFASAMQKFRALVFDIVVSEGPFLVLASITPFGDAERGLVLCIFIA